MYAKLRRARWLAGIAGVLLTAELWLFLLFGGAAVHLAAAQVLRYLQGKPLPPVTNFLFSITDPAPDVQYAWLIVLTGTLLLILLPLFVCLMRSDSISGIALAFAIWAGLLLGFEFVLVAYVVFAFALPFVITTGRMFS